MADIAGPARVIDGNAIEIACQPIRLHGIDAPEGRLTCRQDAVASAQHVRQVRTGHP